MHNNDVITDPLVPPQPLPEKKLQSQTTGTSTEKRETTRNKRMTIQLYMKALNRFHLAVCIKLMDLIYIYFLKVTVAIDDYCKSTKRNRRPLTSKGTYEGNPI